MTYQPDPKFKIEIINGKEYSTDSNTKLLYHMNEKSGTSIDDGSGNGYHGTLNDGTFTAGVFKGGIRFDDDADYINSGQDTPFDFTSSFSVEGWIFIFATGAVEYNIVSKHNSTTSGFRLYLDSNAKINFELLKSGSFLATSTNALDTNRWYHVAGVFNYVHGRIIIYIDGIFDTDAYAESQTNNNLNLYIGTDASSPGGSIGTWDVVLDEIRVSNTTRTSFRTYKDVSSYVMQDSTLIDTVVQSVASGNLRLDTNVSSALDDLTTGNEIRIWIGYTTPSYHLFTGILEGIVEHQNFYEVSFVSYAKLLIRRTHSEVYRSDLGTGTATTILGDIIDAEIPELWYDSTSIPSDTFVFARYTPQSAFINEIFDYIADILGRVWYVDKYKKVYVIDREFTDSSYTLEYGENIIGEPTKVLDVSKWANYVIVDGQKMAVGYQESFNGDGTTTLFSLSKVPLDIEVTVGGVIKKGSFTGAYNYENADYVVDAIQKKLTFTSAPGVGSGNIVVSYRYLTKVHDERQSAGSIDSYGRVDKALDLKNIETTDDATEIANNYLGLYAEPLVVYTGRTIGTTSFFAGQKVRYINSGKSINELFNCIEITYNFGVSGFTMSWKLNDFPMEFQDMYKELLLRIRRLEEADKISGEYIVVYRFWGKNILVKLTEVKLEEQLINDSFVWNHPVAANGYWGTAKWGDRRSAATLIHQWV